MNFTKLYTIVEQLNVTHGETTALVYVTNRAGANVRVAEYPSITEAAAAVAEFKASDARRFSPFAPNKSEQSK